MKSNPKIVCLGGGTGQSNLLRGLKKYTSDIVGIVGVTDSGRSTGTLRKYFDILAPGDIRNCLVALSDSPELLKDLFQYRFEKGKDLSGMAFGNLFITAMTKITGRFDKAIKEVGKVLRITGKIFPATTKNVHICAELKDGKKVREEVNVRAINKAPIKRVYLSHPAKALKETIREIKNADIIVLGPGGLYCSVITNLLVPDIAKAIVESKAQKVYVCNILTQPGQTDSYGATKHVKEIEKYLGKGVLDYVILNTSELDKKIIANFKKTNQEYICPDEGKIKKLGYKTITADLVDFNSINSKEWNKLSMISHDSEKISSLIMSIVRPPIVGVILVAGKGTRMKPFSLSRSKEMFPICGLPLIAHHVEEFVGNNIKDFVIICNDRNHGIIRDYFLKYYPECNFEFPVQRHQFGPAHALNCARKYLKDDFFILRYGDSLAEFDQIKGVVEEFNKNPRVDTVITLRKVKEPREYGIAKFDKNERVIEIVEKPKNNFPSDLANVGLCLLNGKKFFKAFKEIGYEKVIPPPEYILRTDGISSHWVYFGKRIDVGRVWNILEASKLLIKKRGAKIESKRIHPSAKIATTAFISKNARIDKNVIIKGYSSVSGHIKEGSVIDNSVILIKTTVGKKSKISNSVIGRAVTIGSGFNTKVEGSKISVYVKDKYVNLDIKKLGCFVADNVKISDNITTLPGRMIFPGKKISSNVVTDRLTRAILFDLDNTILKTKQVAHDADMSAMKIFAKELKTKTADDLYATWQKIVFPLVKDKNPAKRQRRYSYEKLLKKFKIFNEDLLKKGVSSFMNAVVKNIEVNNNFNLLLPSFANYRLVVFTEDSEELALKKLKKFKLDTAFDLIVTSSNVGTMKPSKKYLDKIFSELDLNPNEVVVVGDNFIKDLALSKKSGATTVLLKNKNNEKKSKASYEITDLNELVKILDEI